MAGERTLPGLGLKGFWTLGDNTWKPGLDANLLAISALTQLSVKTRTAALPATPVDGDVCIVPAADATNGNKIAVRDNGAWTYVTPKKGFRAFVEEDSKFYYFDGAAWTVEVTAAAPGTGGTGGTGGTSKVTPTYKGARVRMSANQALTASAYTTLSYATVDRDTNTFFAAANPTRLTIPAGVTKVRLRAGMDTDIGGANANVGLVFQKNGASFAGGSGHLAEGGNFALRFLESDVIDVVAGDYFIVRAWSSISGNVAAGNGTYFAIEVVEGSILDQTVSGGSGGVVDYDVGFGIEGKIANGETVGRFLSPRAWKIAASAPSSIAKAGVAATASTVLSLKKNGTEFGTVTFAAAGTAGTFAVAAETAFATGDLLTVVGPATADATLADIGLTLAGIRT